MIALVGKQHANRKPKTFEPCDIISENRLKGGIPVRSRS